MRTLSALAESLIDNDGLDVAWVLSVAWPDGTLHYAHRDVSLGGNAVANGLLEPGRMRSSAKAGPGLSGRRSSQRLDVVLRLDGGESPSVRVRLFSTPPESLEVTWGAVLLDAAGTASVDDRVELFCGVVEQAVVTRLGLRLECVDVLSARGRERFGVVVHPESAPEAWSPAVGRMLPWVFGSPGRMELMEWKPGVEVATAREVLVTDTVIELRSVESLPPRGSLQLGDERLSYEAVDMIARTIGTSGSPLSRPEAAAHSAGTAGRLVPLSGAFEWLVAGHACRSVSALQADGLPVDASLYSAVTDAWEGRVVEKVVMAKWPMRTEYALSSSSVLFAGTSLWTVAAASTADAAGYAVDDAGYLTGATMDTGRALLQLGYSGSLDEGLMLYGLLESAVIRARVSSSDQWESTTTVRLRFMKGTTEVETTLPRPDVSGSYGPVDFDLDLGQVIADGGWSALDGGFTVELEIDGVGDATLFRVWDVALVARYRERRRATMARELTAKVEGYEDSGTLLENPAELIRFFLTHEDALGLAESRIDDASFAEANGVLSSWCYEFSNVLTNARRLDGIIDRLLLESRSRLVFSGEKVMLRVESADHVLESATTVIDESGLLREPEREVKRDRDGQILREARLYFGCDFSGVLGGASWRSGYWEDTSLPPEEYGARGVVMEERLRWHNHGSTAVVANLARALLDRYGVRRERVEVATPLSFLASEEGDAASLVDGFFPLALEQGRVETVSFAEPSRMLLGLRFAVAGVVCWEYDAMTFMRHAPNSGPKEFWIEGRLVATLRWDGWLRLTGVLREWASLGSSQTEAVVYDAALERIVFGTGAAGMYVPRFAIDNDGNLLVAGTVREQWPREDVVMGDCVDARNELAALSLGAGERALAVFDTASERLDLRATLTELCPF